MITGATGKVGSAVARHLATQGWSLVLTSRDASRCEHLVSELRSVDCSVQAITLDLMSEDSLETFAKRVAERGTSITHVVSNARSLDTLAVMPNSLAQSQTFMAELTMAVVGPYRLIMSLVHHAKHNLCAIVTIGSQYGVVTPNPLLYGGDLDSSPVQYGVAKAALHHLTRELAVRLAPKIRVNCVAFGGFQGRTDDSFQERYSRLSPLRRMLTEADAGGPVAFLLDDAASAAVTGHVLLVDGGWSIW